MCPHTNLFFKNHSFKFTLITCSNKPWRLTLIIGMGLKLTAYITS